VTGPREAVLKSRIHGGIKAREINVEEARASSGWTPCGGKISKFAMDLLDGGTTRFNRGVPH
jgi:hypothetical protein